MHVCVIGLHCVVKVGLRFIRPEEINWVGTDDQILLIASLARPVCVLTLLLDGAVVSVGSRPGMEVEHS